MTNQERIAALEDLLVKNPGDSFSRYALALEYAGLGESGKAVAELKDLIRRDPKYIAAYHQLGRIYCRMNKTADAKLVYRQGIELAAEANDVHEKTEMEEELEEIEDEW